MIDRSAITLRVVVTEQHIRRGVPRDPCLCALALAIADAVGVGEIVVTDYVKVQADDAEPVIYTLPDSAEWFQRRFDSRQAVEPFEFDMREQ